MTCKGAAVMDHGLLLMVLLAAAREMGHGLLVWVMMAAAMRSSLLVLILLGAGDALVGLITKANADKDEGGLMLIVRASVCDSWLGGCADDIMTGD